MYKTAYLVEPIRVENLKTAQFPSSTFLSNGPLAALEFELGDTLVGWLSIHDTLGNWPLPSTTPHTHTVNNITLQTFQYWFLDA